MTYNWHAFLTDVGRYWPAICTAVALGLLLVLIIWGKVQAFVALLMASLFLGLAAGMQPEKVVVSIGKGVGEILAGVAVILALGAMLGRMLEASGAAEVIARTLVRAFGEARASLAILAAAYLIGIPVLFNVGFLLLIPIMWRLQRDTGRSLLYFVLPLTFSLGVTHSLVPPHPGIVGAINNLVKPEDASRVMIETIIFGSLMGIPLVLVGWLGPARFWARRRMVTVPEHLAAENNETAPTEEAAENHEGPAPPAFSLCVLIVTLPLILSLTGFGAKLLGDQGLLPAWMTQPLFDASELPFLEVFAHAPLEWVRLLGHPTMALLVPTGLAFVLLGLRRGMPAERLSKLATQALQDVGGIAFLFGAAGGFKEVIVATGAGQIIAELFLEVTDSKVAVAYVVAVMVRIALGSATAAILTASSVLGGVARLMPGQETLIVLAVANGVTFMTQPADSGFWMVKEYCNLTVRDVLLRFNGCRIVMSLTGLGILLIYEAWLSK
jgi:gluconate transporter